jgi:proliferating cell nuclear antigen
MAKEKVKAKAPKEGILDPEVPAEKEIEFKGEIKGDAPLDEKQDEESEESEDQFHLVAKAGLLKETIGLCSSLVDDVKLKIKSNGIKIAAVDPAHICLVELTLSGEACDEYDATNFELGITLEKLSGILKLAKDAVTIDYDPKEKRLVFKMDTLTRRMGTIDPEGMADPTIPKMVTPSKFAIPAQHFTVTLEACEQISDHMRISVDKAGIKIFTESDADTVMDEIPKDRLIELNTTGTFSSDYSLEYLKNATKGAKESIKFGMSNDNPLQMEYTFAEGKGTVQYVLAPRIEGDGVKND